MSTGNPLIDALDALVGKVDALAVQVKAADPRAVLDAARAGAGTFGPDLREATKQALEATQTARGAADLERALGRRLILSALLAAFLAGAAVGGIATARWLEPMDRLQRAGPQWAAANQRAYDAVMDLSGKVSQLATRTCPPTAPTSPPQPPRTKRYD